MTAVLVSLSAVAPALGQGRDAPAAARPATGANAFKAPAGSPLATQNGRPVWEVYSDCSWANLNAFKAMIKAESQRNAGADSASQAAAARQANASTASVYGSLNGLPDIKARDAQRAQEIETQKALSSRSDALNVKAIDAYAAQTGKPRAEVKSFVEKAPAVAVLTVDQCKGLPL